MNLGRFFLAMSSAGAGAFGVQAVLHPDVQAWHAAAIGCAVLAGVLFTASRPGR